MKHPPVPTKLNWPIGPVFILNTPQFLKEIVENAIPNNSGVLQKPFQVFQNYLSQIADRCAEINDPILNKLMCNMALYEEADMFSKEYDKEKVKKAEDAYLEFLKDSRKEEN